MALVTSMVTSSSSMLITVTGGAPPSRAALTMHRFLVFALLNAAEPDAQLLRALLGRISAEERARHDGLPAGPGRAEFVVSRALLRRVLGTLLDQAPPDVRLAVTARGKPLLRERPAVVPALRFNFSHSAGHHLLAVTQHGEIGADIEAPGPYKERIAQRFFHPEEARWIERLDPAERVAAFYQLWTVKEACLKALGIGLTFPQPRVRVPCEPFGTCLGLQWQTLDLPPTVKAAVAIALDDEQAAPHRIQTQIVDLEWLLEDR